MPAPQMSAPYRQKTFVVQLLALMFVFVLDEPLQAKVETHLGGVLHSHNVSN